MLLDWGRETGSLCSVGPLQRKVRQLRGLADTEDFNQIRADTVKRDPAVGRPGFVDGSDRGLAIRVNLEDTGAQPLLRGVAAASGTKSPGRPFERRLASLFTPNQSRCPQHSEHQEDSAYDLVEEMDTVTPQQSRSCN